MDGNQNDFWTMGISTLAKLNNIGHVLWSTNISLGDITNCSSGKILEISPGPSGDCFVSSYRVISNVTGLVRSSVTQYDTDGKEIWQWIDTLQQYGAFETTFFNTINSCVYTIERINSFGYTRYSILKFDRSGNLEKSQLIHLSWDRKPNDYQLRFVPHVSSTGLITLFFIDSYSTRACQIN